MDAYGAKDNAVEAVCNDIRHLGVSYKFDCKFIVGSGADKETVFGCKHLCAIESPVLERMLLGDFLEGKKSTEGILLPDDDPKAVRHFRLLTYCSERVSRMKALSLDDTLSLARFCEKYMALSISKLCTDRLMAISESVPIVGLIKMFACVRNFPETSLFEKVKMKLKRHNYPLHEALNDINQESFMTYLCHHLQIESNLNISNVLTAIERYLNHNDLMPNNLLDDKDIKHQTNAKTIQEDASKTPNKTDVADPENLDFLADKKRQIFLRDLLKNIDFSRIDTIGFLSGPSESNILTCGQKYYIIINICKKKTPIKLFEN